MAKDVKTVVNITVYSQVRKYLDIHAIFVILPLAPQQWIWKKKKKKLSRCV